MVKKIIIYIINLFLIVSIFAFATLLILSNTIMNKEFVIGVLEKNNYYEKTYYEIQDGFKNYIMQSGLEENIIENLYNMDKVQKDINVIIDSIYENKEININTEVIRNELDNKINEVLKQNNKKIDNSEKKSIQTFENVIIDVYKTGITYSEEAIKQICNAFEKLQSLFVIAQIILIVIILILMLTIILINKNIKETAKTFAITMITVGCASITLKILLGVRVTNILILNKTFSESLVYMINSIMNTLFIMGIAMFIIGVIITIINAIKEQ